MGKEAENRYRVSDPFFVVECGGCGARYWSTRRINVKCAKCGKENPITHLPEYIKKAE